MILRKRRVLVSSMKIVALFALFDRTFIFVRVIGGSDDGDCGSEPPPGGGNSAYERGGDARRLA